MKPLVPPTPAALETVRALAERQLSPEEIRAALARPIGEAEEEESRALIGWFRRRYPTPAERLTYARRAYRRWRAALPTAVTPPPGAATADRLSHGRCAGRLPGAWRATIGGATHDRA